MRHGLLPKSTCCIFHLNIIARKPRIIVGIPTPSPTPSAIFSLLLRLGLSTTLTSCGFEDVEDGAAVEAESFIIEVKNFVRLDVDVEEGVEDEVGLGIVVEGSTAVVLVTGLVLVIILVTGGILEAAGVLVIILVEEGTFESVVGAVKAINSGLRIPIPDPVLRQFASTMSQTGPEKPDPQRVLVHIATAFKKVMLEHKQAFDTAGVVVVVSGQPDAMASANKHG